VELRAEAGGEAGEAVAEEFFVVEGDAGHAVEGEGGAGVGGPVVLGEDAGHAGGVGGADFGVGGLGFPIREHAGDAGAVGGVEGGGVRGEDFADGFFEAVVAEAHEFGAEAGEGVADASGEGVAGAHGLEHRGELEAEDGGFASGGVGVAVGAVAVGEGEFEREGFFPGGGKGFEAEG
jgi:hypothetical protein